MIDQVTSIEQSKRLIEMGVPAEKASMAWVKDPNEGVYSLAVHDEFCYEMSCLEFDDMWFENGEDGGWFPANTECNQDLMMRDDDYLERLERGEYGDHIADASKMITTTVKK